jgi:glycosyltransferase involved in cell wall biosynthesis
MARTISDRELMRRIGESGRELVKNHYSHAGESKKLVSLIAELTGSRG